VHARLHENKYHVVVSSSLSDSRKTRHARSRACKYKYKGSELESISNALPSGSFVLDSFHTNSRTRYLKQRGTQLAHAYGIHPLCARIGERKLEFSIRFVGYVICPRRLAIRETNSELGSSFKMRNSRLSAIGNPVCSSIGNHGSCVLGFGSFRISEAYHVFPYDLNNEVRKKRRTDS
jgi:hypothetical protein